jgi:hypothetical protein
VVLKPGAQDARAVFGWLLAVRQAAGIIPPCSGGSGRMCSMSQYPSCPGISRSLTSTSGCHDVTNSRARSAVCDRIAAEDGQ